MLLINGKLGRRIAYYRKKLKLSQVKLATTSGLYPKYISDVEAGRKVRSVQTLARLAVALGISIDELNGHS